jgi:hypothetical protein
MLSEFYESTVVEVKAAFGFSEFECHPERITEAMGLEPDSAFEEGEALSLPGGKSAKRAISHWSISSSTGSKDINVHLRELLSRMEGKEVLLTAEFGTPQFYVTWKGNDLYAGSGPFYEADVLQGIAEFGGELWQDIYQVDSGEGGGGGGG